MPRVRASLEPRHCRNVVQGFRVVLHRVVSSIYGSIARLDTPDLAWRVPGTLMFFEGLLGEAVEWRPLCFRDAERSCPTGSRGSTSR